jgi:hypothetical protein
MSIARSFCIAAFAVAGTVPAIAQEGMVTVELRNVSPTVASNINIDASRLPATVQLPIGVAAQVCGIDASVLAQRTGDNRCLATTTSTALDQAVQRQLRDDTGPRADTKGHQLKKQPPPERGR